MKAANFQKAQETEQELTDEKNRDFENIMRPNLFYVTFKYEDARDAIVKMGSIKFMEEEIPIRGSKEPNTFYWENVQITDNQRKFRGIVIILIMMFLFFWFFLAAIWAIKQKLLIEYFKNPPGIECDNLHEFFGDKLQD